MPSAKKSEVAGAGPSRSAGGRPRKRPAESPPEEPPPQPPDALPAKVQETTCSAELAASEPESSLPPQPLELPPWKPTPTDPPMFPDPRARWRYARPISNDRVPSAIKMPRFLSRRQVEQKVELQRRYPYNNGICTCENGGLPSSGDDADHSMFCQLYKCYACEIGCCEGRVYAPKSKDDPTMTWWWAGGIATASSTRSTRSTISAVRMPSFSSAAPAVTLGAISMSMALWTGQAAARCFATASAGIWAALIFLCALSARMA